MNLNDQYVENLVRLFLTPAEQEKVAKAMSDIFRESELWMAGCKTPEELTKKRREMAEQDAELERIQREADGLTKERDDILRAAQTKEPAKATTVGTAKTTKMTGRWEGFAGHARYYELLTAAAEIHTRKNHDYAGKDVHPFDNFLQARKLGVTPSLGTLIRASDKWNRISSLLRNGEGAMVKDESIKDTLLDLANYCIIAYILMEEEEAGLI